MQFITKACGLILSVVPKLGNIEISTFLFPWLKLVLVLRNGLHLTAITFIRLLLPNPQLRYDNKISLSSTLQIILV